MCMWLGLCMCTQCVQESAEARKGCLISWNWSYTQWLWATIEVLGTGFGFSGRMVSTLTCWAIALFPPHLWLIHNKQTCPSSCWRNPASKSTSARSQKFLPLWSLITDVSSCWWIMMFDLLDCLPHSLCSGLSATMKQPLYLSFSEHFP